MVNCKQSVIKFRQSLIFAVNEVAGASVKQDKSEDPNKCPESGIAEGAGNARENFKNVLENYLRIIRVQSSVLESESDLTGIKDARHDAAVDLCTSLDDLWRSVTACSNKL